MSNDQTFRPSYIIAIRFEKGDTTVHYTIECDPETMTLDVAGEDAHYILEGVDPVGRWQLAAKEICAAISLKDPSLDMRGEALFLSRLIQAVVEAIP